MKKTATLIILFLSAVTAGFAQSEAKLDADSILIGEQTRLTITGAEQFPSTEALSQNGIVALRQEFNSETQTQTTVITSFTPGEHYIHITENDSIMLRVGDVADVDTSSAEIRDIAEIQREPYSFWEIFRWILLGLAVVGVGFGSYLVRTKFPKAAILAHSDEIKEPADVRALANLEALRRESLWQSGRSKEYHTRLTDIVRQYLEEACGIASTDMTSDETLEAFRQSAVADASVGEMMASMLRRADMVKFAKSEPLPYEHDKSMDEAVAIVKQIADKLNQNKATEEVKDE